MMHRRTSSNGVRAGPLKRDGATSRRTARFAVRFLFLLCAALAFGSTALLADSIYGVDVTVDHVCENVNNMLGVTVAVGSLDFFTSHEVYYEYKFSDGTDYGQQLDRYWIEHGYTH